MAVVEVIEYAVNVIVVVAATLVEVYKVDVTVVGNVEVVVVDVSIVVVAVVGNVEVAVVVVWTVEVRVGPVTVLVTVVVGLYSVVVKVSVFRIVTLSGIEANRTLYGLAWRVHAMLIAPRLSQAEAVSQSRSEPANP